MHKRLLSMLVIGGVTVLCFAPKVVRAEDGSAQWQGRRASNIDFAEIPTPTPAVQVQEVQAPAPLPTLEVLRPDQQYRSLVEKISRSNSVDPDLIDAMIRTESNYNPWAISSKGARGLMQLIPETGRRFGVQNFFDPQQNIEGGVRYVKYLLDMFGGNVELSLAAYNAGEHLVARLGTIPPIPETRNYVRKIRAAFTKPSGSLITDLTPVSTTEFKKQPAPAAPIIPEEFRAPVADPISIWLDERGVHHFSNLEN